tara:strand:- start:14267 stop:14491 length:225 start_codon:yes stop_codon:yes gene_type:complete
MGTRVEQAPTPPPPPPPSPAPTRVDTAGQQAVASAQAGARAGRKSTILTKRKPKQSVLGKNTKGTTSILGQGKM